MLYRPEPVTLWTDPKKDSGFQGAIQENRVTTVIQKTVGTHKDFGVIGFQRAEHTSYWIFPKSLDRFKGKRVIGIKYDLLNVPKPKDPVKLTEEPATKSPAKDVGKRIQEPAEPSQPKPQPEKTKPEPHRFRVTIRCTATTEIEDEVEAKSATEAGELALSMVANEAVDFAAGKVSRKVVGVRRAART